MFVRFLARRAHTTLFAAAFVVAVLGCGGEGDGGTTPTTSSLICVGNTDPAVIMEANAASLAANVIGGTDAPRAIAAQGRLVDPRRFLKPAVVERPQDAVHTLSDALLGIPAPASGRSRPTTSHHPPILPLAGGHDDHIRCEPRGRAKG